MLVAHNRVARRYYDNMTHYEPKATNSDHCNNPISKEDDDILALCSRKAHEDDYDADDATFKQLEKGSDFKWDKTPQVPGIIFCLLFFDHIIFLKTLF